MRRGWLSGENRPVPHNLPGRRYYQRKVFHAYYNCDRGINDDEYAYIHFQRRPMPARVDQR
jgi:hypothetical protein